MTIKTKSEAAASPLLRVPKAKTKLGLKIPKIALPHDDLISAEKPKFEVVPKNAQPESLPSQTSMSSQTKQLAETGDEIAPTKNYQKVANSITKQAIPDGFFKGKDKHLYDVLYSLTRGAIEPKRSVRISKTKLRKLSSIGSRITFDACIERLESVGLLILKIYAGEHEGNAFEILLPEEAVTLTSQTSLTSPAQKLDRLVRLETSQTSQSLNSMNATTSIVPKTSFKDFIKNDDENGAPFSEFVEKFSAACERITGKPTTIREREKWGTLADLLILELESAARKTDAISSAPAFLTEILRRKLVSGVLPSASKNQKAKPDAMDKPNTAGEYEIKTLDEQGRSDALTQLQEFADEEFLKDFEKWYTNEDWKWLTENLKKSKEPRIRTEER